MDIQVDWNGQKATIPHPSVPAFRLLCEQYGFLAKWNVKEKKLQLEKEDLKSRRVCLISKSSSDLEKQILQNVEHFLSETGMEVLVYSDPQVTTKQGDVSLQCSIKSSSIVERPECKLVTTAKPFPKKLVESLQKDLRSMHTPSKVNRIASKRTLTPFVQVDLTLPEMKKHTEQEFIEEVSIHLASGILRYFQDKHPMTLLASLSPEIRQTFLDIVPSLQHETSNEETKETPALPELVSAVPSATSDTEDVPHIKEAKAEVFFDYTLLTPMDEDDSWLIVGNLNIKNTGSEILYNPTVALQLDPPSALRIGGQILPPHVVDTLGVQNEGATVWKFLDEDYLKKGRETGIYYIGTKNELLIEPGETQMHGLQITVIKSEVEGAVTIKGAVQFKQQGLQYVSNNQISLSL